MALIDALRSIIGAEAAAPQRHAAPCQPAAPRGPVRGHRQAGCGAGTKRRIVCNFDPEIFDRVVARAAASEVTVSEMVRRLVERGLKRADAAREPKEAS